MDQTLTQKPAIGTAVRVLREGYLQGCAGTVARHVPHSPAYVVVTVNRGGGRAPEDVYLDWQTELER